MRTLAPARSATLRSLSLGLLLIAAAWTAQPARAADERVAALSRPCTAGSLCAAEVARLHTATPAAAVKPSTAAKPAAVRPAAKNSRHGNYEHDLWRHQGVG